MSFARVREQFDGAGDRFSTKVRSQCSPSRVPGWWPCRKGTTCKCSKRHSGNYCPKAGTKLESKTEPNSSWKIALVSRRKKRKGKAVKATLLACAAFESTAWAAGDPRSRRAVRAQGATASTTSLSGPSPASLSAVTLSRTCAPEGKVFRFAFNSVTVTASTKSALTPTTCLRTR